MIMKNKLRSMIEHPGIWTAPGVYDCVGAMLAERAGFDLVFSSGFGIAASVLGKPDFGYLTANEMIGTDELLDTGRKYST